MMHYEMKERLRETINYWENEESGVQDDDIRTYLEDLAAYIHETENFKLYKYYPADYYSFRNLELKQVHLSPNGNLNDVYEGVPACNEEVQYEDICRLSTLALTTSFSEKNNSTLMWAHYADSSKGFCVEYDLKRLSVEEIMKLTICPVLYEEKRFISRSIKELAEDLLILDEGIQKEEEYSGKSSLTDLIPLVLYKGKDWEYESEWRMICTKMDLYNQYSKSTVGINIPIGCISGIIMGCRMEKEKREHMQGIVRNMISEGKDIVLYEANTTQDTFDLKIDVI